MKSKPESTNVDSLIVDLTCDVVTRCQNARRALIKMGSTAVPILIQALNNKNQWVRWEAMKALSQIGDPTATEELIKLLEHKDFDMRWMAAEGLIAIGRNALPPLFRALIDHSDSTWLQEGAHHVLHDMRRGDLDKILKPVMKSLESVGASSEITVEAEKALQQIEKAK